MFGVAIRTAEILWQSMGACHSVNEAVHKSYIIKNHV